MPRLTGAASLATERQTRRGSPAGTPRLARLAATMLLNALATGLPSNLATPWRNHVGVQGLQRRPARLRHRVVRADLGRMPR